MSLLNIKNLKVYFRDDRVLTKALDGIDLSIDKDEVVGLVGESGSGKTMTALSIMRLLPFGGYIESGEITFEGKNLLDLKEKEMLDIRGEKIGMVFQEPFTSLNPVLRVGEQISEAILTHTSTSAIEAEREAKDLLRKVRIDDPQKVYFDYPHQLSGGQRQRVMLAAALSLKPKLLIADEPTTALDVTIESEILSLLSDMKRDFGISILFITHDIGVVNEIADRMIVMKDGRIVEVGTKDAIMQSPKAPYTRRLLDAVPRINLEEIRMQDRESDTFLKIDSIKKAFSIERGFLKSTVGRIEAVDGVSLKIAKGETLGLVGESACGKTTLGKIIVGLLEPDSGSIIINGRELKSSLKETPKEIREMMQIVFQDPYGSLDPHIRMGDIVLEGPRILGIPKGEREGLLKDVLHKVSLRYADAHKYPHQFSGGERQRIAIARALAVKPQFLVLDEPVSSLDVSIQAKILELLRRLQAELDLTYLFISHDLRVVGSMADEVAVMYRGKIVEHAPKTEIFTSPKHPYTQKLLSSLPQL